MNLNLLIPLLITTVVAIAGWYVGAYLNATRDRRQALRELRIKHLLDVYRRLERSVNRSYNQEALDNIEIAISDLQLLGSLDQVRLARTFATTFWKQGSEDIDITDILYNLRDSLRKELGLETIPSDDRLLGILRLYDTSQTAEGSSSSPHPPRAEIVKEEADQDTDGR